MFGYISNATYVLQGPLGLSPFQYSLVFAVNALVPTLLALVNVRLIARFEPRVLIVVGLALAALGVVTLVVSATALGLALIPTCAGFMLIMSANAFIFGNAASLALGQSRELAGTASSVLGVAQSLANAVSAPLATSGGSSATPMIMVMIAGSIGAWLAFWVIARGGRAARPNEAAR